MSCFVLSSDLHLTAREADEYRWAVFPFLAKVAKAYGTRLVVLGGDIVDKKDNHPAALVDRLVNEFKRYALDWVIVMGNHDYVEPTQPFFGFLDNLPNVQYVREPTTTSIAGMHCLLIPHNRDWHSTSDWRKRHDLSGANGKPYDYIIAHQTFAGCKASNGQEMQGVPLSTVSLKATGGAPVLAGDIHVPQTIGNVTYVGSPHPVNFGDHFVPRVLVVDRDGTTPVEHSACPARVMLKLTSSDVESWKFTESLYEADQCKVQLTLTRAESMDVQRLRDAIVHKIRHVGAQHFGTDIKIIPDDVQEDTPDDTGNLLRATPESVFQSYCEQRGVEDSLAEAGKAYL